MPFNAVDLRSFWSLGALPDSTTDLWALIIWKTQQAPGNDRSGNLGPSESHRLMYVLRSKEIDLSERRSNAPPSSLLPAPWFRMWRGSIWVSLRPGRTELTCHGYWVPQRLLVHTSNIHPYIHGKDDSIPVCARVLRCLVSPWFCWFTGSVSPNVIMSDQQSLFDWLLGSLIICSKVNLRRIKRPTTWCPRYVCCFRHPTN